MRRQSAARTPKTERGMAGPKGSDGKTKPKKTHNDNAGARAAGAKAGQGSEKGKKVTKTIDKKKQKNDVNGPGFIYIVKEAELGATSPNSGTGNYKIGLTNKSQPNMEGSIRDRITNFQTGNPRPLYFKGIRVPEMKQYESYAHWRQMNDDIAERVYLPFGKKEGETEWFTIKLKQGKTEDEFVNASAQALQVGTLDIEQPFSKGWTACRTAAGANSKKPGSDNSSKPDDSAKPKTQNEDPDASTPKHDPNGPGFIYIVKETEAGTGYYKIGLTNESKLDDMEGSIRDRITNFQTGNPRPLYFKGIRVPKMKQYESYAHWRQMNDDIAERVYLPFGKKEGETEWFTINLKEGKTEDEFVKASEQALQEGTLDIEQPFSKGWTACRKNARA